MDSLDYEKTMLRLVLSLIPTGKNNAVPQKDLMFATRLSRRKLKVYITMLREEHPICSKETDGGGYWIAEGVPEMQEFICMIERRMTGYRTTINKMQKLISEKGL